VASRHLGHSDIGIILDLYGHFFTERAGGRLPLLTAPCVPP